MCRSGAASFSFGSIARRGGSTGEGRGRAPGRGEGRTECDATHRRCRTGAGLPSMPARFAHRVADPTLTL